MSSLSILTSILISFNSVPYDKIEPICDRLTDYFYIDARQNNIGWKECDADKLCLELSDKVDGKVEYCGEMQDEIKEGL